MSFPKNLTAFAIFQQFRRQLHATAPPIFVSISYICHKRNTVSKHHLFIINYLRETLQPKPQTKPLTKLKLVAQQQKVSPEAGAVSQKPSRRWLLTIGF